MFEKGKKRAKNSGSKSGGNFRAILSMVLVGALLLSLGGCQSKKPASNKDFQEKMEGLGYTVEDMGEQYSSYDHIKEALIIESGNLHAEFFEMDTVENCEGVYITNEKTVEEKNTGTAVETSATSGDYQKKTVKTDDGYYVIIRVKNTMLYAYCDLEETEKLDEIVKAINY